MAQPPKTVVAYAVLLGRGDTTHAKDYLMRPTKIFSFVCVSILLAACSEESAPEAFDDTVLHHSPPDEGQGTPATGESCHVDETAVIDGTMTVDNQCCGVAVCLDRDTCGDDFGSWEKACSNCDEYRCEAGLVPSSSAHPGGDGTNNTVSPKSGGGLNGQILIKPSSGGLNGTIIVKPISGGGMNGTINVKPG